MRKIGILLIIAAVCLGSCSLSDLFKTTYDIQIKNSASNELFINVTQSTSTPPAYVKIIADGELNFFRVGRGKNYVHIRENSSHKTTDHSISVYSDSQWEITKTGSGYDVNRKY